MSPKSGRCLNGGISVPQQVMGHVDCTVVTDMPAVDILEASYTVSLGPDRTNEALKRT